jgi:hypothetical protein
MHSGWPRLLERKLWATNNRASEHLEKRARLAVRIGASDSAVTSSSEAATAYVERTFDPADPVSLCQNAALVCECLNIIRSDGDASFGTPVLWRESLPYARARTGRAPTPATRPTCAQRCSMPELCASAIAQRARSSPARSWACALADAPCQYKCAASELRLRYAINTLK